MCGKVEKIGAANWTYQISDLVPHRESENDLERVRIETSKALDACVEWIEI